MASSKMVNDRQRSAANVIQAARTHRDEAAAALARLLDPAVPWARVFDALAGALAATIDPLVAADRANEAEKADDPAARRARDRAMADLYAEITSLRGTVDAMYGRDGLDVLGMTGPTPREPIALIRLGEAVRDHLDALDALTPIARGARLSVVECRVAVADRVAALRATNDEVVRETRELEATRAAKRAAMAAHDARFSAVAGTVERLFLLAGKLELAERVRPAQRRPGRTEVETGDAPALVPISGVNGDAGEAGASESSEPSEPSGPVSTSTPRAA